MGRWFKSSRGSLKRLCEQHGRFFVFCTTNIGSFNISGEHSKRISSDLDGEVVARDEAHMNGWWAERGALELFSLAYEALRDGNDHRIAARCESISGLFC